MEHLMAVQTLFPKGTTLDIRDASKVKYFAADKCKSLICIVFIYKSRYGLFLRVSEISHNLFSNNFLQSCLIQFFFIKVF